MRRALLIILAALAVAACQKLEADPAAVTAARGLFDQLRAGQDAAVIAQMGPNANTPKMVAQIDKIRSFIPPGVPRSSKVVGFSTATTAKTGKHELLRLEYDYGDRTTDLLVELSQLPGVQGWRVQGFHVVTATAKQLAVNDFSFAGKSPMQYLFFAYAVLSPVLMLAALLKVILTPGLKRKWLWGIVAFIGLFTLQMNWATGQLAILWISIQFIGAGMTSGLSRFDPWVVKATFPLGALLILAGVWANPLWAKVKRAKPADGPAPPAA